MTEQEGRDMICRMAKKKSAYPKSVLATHYAASIKADTIKSSRANIVDDTYVPDEEESENIYWMDYDHEQMSCEGFIPQPGPEWNAAIEEARRLHRLKRRDINHPAWPVLREGWERAESPVFGRWDAEPPLLETRDSLWCWESKKADTLVSDLTPLVEKCGAVVLRALVDGDERLFSELAKMIAVAFKTRPKKERKQSNRIRLDVIMLALELWNHRGKNLTLDGLWKVCERRGITEKGMTVAAWNKMIERCHLSFLRTGTTSDKLPDDWQGIMARHEKRLQLADEKTDQSHGGNK